jgi:hypothetical protein
MAGSLIRLSCLFFHDKDFCKLQIVGVRLKSNELQLHVLWFPRSTKNFQEVLPDIVFLRSHVIFPTIVGIH